MKELPLFVCWPIELTEFGDGTGPWDVLVGRPIRPESFLCVLFSQGADGSSLGRPMRPSKFIGSVSTDKCVRRCWISCAGSVKATFLGSSGLMLPVFVGVLTSSTGGRNGSVGLVGTVVAVLIVSKHMSFTKVLNLSRASVLVIIEVRGSNVGVE